MKQMLKLKYAVAAAIVMLSALTTHSKTTDMDKIDQIKQAGYAIDTYTAPSGETVNLVFIKHGSIAVEAGGYLVYIDPVTMFGNDFSVLPKADMILVTHEHGDHFDTKAIDQLTDDQTRFITNARVSEMYGQGQTMQPGDSIDVDEGHFTLTAVPAYNISPDHLQFHPKERKDLGFVFDIGGLRIYVAGDTEDIPEMESLRDIDIAFLPVNQPYTMTPAQAIHAVEMINPKIVYPYHYGQTDLNPLIDRFKDSEVEVKVRQLQ